jgi:diguanylate cyclase (GGDEF)-like protein
MSEVGLPASSTSDARQGDTLRRVYLLVLVVLGSLSIASNLLLSFQVQATRATAQLVNTAGRQRMLAVRIAGDAEHVAVSHESQGLNDLRQSLQAFEAAHTQLSNPASGLYTSGFAPDVRALYSAVVNPQVAEFTALARRILETPPEQLHPNQPEVMRLILQSRGPLLTALEQVVSLDEHRSDLVIARLQWLSWLRVALVLSLLLGMGVFIFRPLEHRNRALLSGLIAERNAVEQQASELALLAQQAEAARQDATVLADLTRILGGSGSLEEILGSTADLLRRPVGAEWIGLIQRREAATAVYALSGAVPTGWNGLLNGPMWLGSELETSALQGQPLFLSEVTMPDSAAAGLGSLALIPLPHKQERGPVMLLVARGDRLPGSWTPNQRLLLEAVARTVCAAWERVTLAEELRRSAAYAQALLQVAALSDLDLPAVEVAHAASVIVANVLDLDWAGLGILDQDHCHVTPVFEQGALPAETRALLARSTTVGQGMVWEVASTGKALFVDDYAAQPQARPEVVAAGLRGLAWIPLGRFGTTRYVLSAARTGQHVWSDADRGLFEAAARTVSVALTQQRYLQELEQAALSDALTGLPNRRSFEQELGSLMAESNRHHQPFAVVMIDMDGLKAVNDLLGHEGGDALLRGFGVGLRDKVRAEDRVFRLGGDEFALLLPHASSEGLRGHLERVQAAVVRTRELGFPQAAASAGIAYYPKDGWSSLELVHLADERMYEDKQDRQLGRSFEKPAER